MGHLGLHCLLEPAVSLNGLSQTDGYLGLLCSVGVVHPAVEAVDLLGCLALDEPELVLFSPAEERVLED